MAVAKRVRSVFVTLLAVLGIALWLIALLSFTRVTENTDDFAQRQTWILLINSVGIAVLLALIVSNLWSLVRDYRRHVPEARSRGIVPMYWDNGYTAALQMGLFNRATGAQAFPDVIAAIVGATQ